MGRKALADFFGFVTKFFKKNKKEKKKEIKKEIKETENFLDKIESTEPLQSVDLMKQKAEIAKRRNAKPPKHICEIMKKNQNDMEVPSSPSVGESIQNKPKTPVHPKTPIIPNKITTSEIPPISPTTSSTSVISTKVDSTSINTSTSITSSISPTPTSSAEVTPSSPETKKDEILTESTPTTSTINTYSTSTTTSTLTPPVAVLDSELSKDLTDENNSINSNVNKITDKNIKTTSVSTSITTSNPLPSTTETKHQAMLRNEPNSSAFQLNVQQTSNSTTSSSSTLPTKSSLSQEKYRSSLHDSYIHKSLCAFDETLDQFDNCENEKQDIKISKNQNKDEENKLVEAKNVIEKEKVLLESEENLKINTGENLSPQTEKEVLVAADLKKNSNDESKKFNEYINNDTINKNFTNNNLFLKLAKTPVPLPRIDKNNHFNKGVDNIDKNDSSLNNLTGEKLSQQEKENKINENNNISKLNDETNTKEENEEPLLKTDLPQNSSENCEMRENSHKIIRNPNVKSILTEEFKSKTEKKISNEYKEDKIDSRNGKIEYKTNNENEENKTNYEDENKSSFASSSETSKTLLSSISSTSPTSPLSPNKPLIKTKPIFSKNQASKEETLPSPPNSSPSSTLATSPTVVVTSTTSCSESAKPNSVPSTDLSNRKLLGKFEMKVAENLKYNKINTNQQEKKDSHDITSTQTSVINETSDSNAIVLTSKNDSVTTTTITNGPVLNPPTKKTPPQIRAKPIK